MGKLGVVKAQDGIIFRAALPEPEKTYLVLYQKGTEEIVCKIPMEGRRIMGDVHGVKLPLFDWRKYEYNYLAGTEILQDRYAGVIRGREKFGEPVEEEKIRCGFDFGAYDWGEDQSLHIPYEDAVMYSLHVRGFTMQTGAKVRHKGTFRGVAEKAEYLRGLGINQVKLMPAYEFDEIMKRYPGRNGMQVKESPSGKLNFWGYGPGFYFAPKASYAAGADPVREMKDMVKTLHEHGIEVIMEMNFTDDVSIGMACDCLSHWVMEYHIDGFHIVGNDRLAHMMAREPMLAGVKLIAAYFPTEEIYPAGKRPRVRNLAEYNVGFLEDARALLKGDDRKVESFAGRIRKNPALSGVVNYLASHDGFTMADLVSYNDRHNEENGERGHDGPQRNISWNCGVEGPTKKKKILELRKRQVKNAFLMLLLAAGTPMIQAGDEFGNSQGGNNNPYCLDNETSWVDWRAARRNAELTAFVRDAVAFRQRHRILHTPLELKNMDSLSSGYPDLSYHSSRAWYGEFDNGNREIGVMYSGAYVGDEEFIYVAYNLHWETREFALPNLPEGMRWYVAIDTAAGVSPEGEEPAFEGEKLLTVPERTIRVLIGRR